MKVTLPCFKVIHSDLVFLERTMLREGKRQDNLNIHTPLTFRGGERKNCRKVGLGNHRGGVPALVRWENRFGPRAASPIQVQALP